MKKMHASLILFFVILLSCKKNNTPEGEEQSIYPHTLKFSSLSTKGNAELYSNKQVVNDPEGAAVFIAHAADLYEDHFYPPVSLTFHSRDTGSIKYVTNLGTDSIIFGIHAEGEKYRLISRYGYTETLYDTAMLVAVIDGNNSAHPVLIASGNTDEFKISTFAYKIRNYKMYNGEPVFKSEKMTGHFNEFNMNYINRLTSLDTLGIQRYEVTFK